MAERRMFAKTITTSDAFLEMPLTAQCLYFHLNMNADDDGFINNYKSIMRMIGSREDDIKILVAKNFIIPFDSGVIVIKHWRLNNYLRNDRYKPTEYQEELAKLSLKDNKSYTLPGSKEDLVYQMDTNGIPVVDQMDTQVSIGKVSIGKDSIGKDKEKESSIDATKEKATQLNPRLHIPTLEEVAEYCKERNNGIDPEKFLDHQTEVGWKTKNNVPIKDWKATIRNWERYDHVAKVSKMPTKEEIMAKILVPSDLKKLTPEECEVIGVNYEEAQAL